MDLPLVLRAVGEKKLVYGIPLWYRLAMALIAILLVGGILVAGESPGLFAWILIGLAALAALYEETWVFDAEARELRHRYGLLIAARKLVLPFDAISVFRLRPFVRGTVPGSEDEKAENEAALAFGRSHSLGQVEVAAKRRPLFKKPFLTLVCEDREGEALMLNSLPARRGDSLRTIGASIAVFCGKALEEG